METTQATGNLEREAWMDMHSSVTTLSDHLLAMIYLGNSLYKTSLKKKLALEVFRLETELAMTRHG